MHITCILPYIMYIIYIGEYIGPESFIAMGEQLIHLLSQYHTLLPTLIDLEVKQYILKSWVYLIRTLPHICEHYIHGVVYTIHMSLTRPVIDSGTSDVDLANIQQVVD